jgi:hypothetical protein
MLRKQTLDEKKRNFKDDMKKAIGDLTERLTKLDETEKSEAEKTLEDVRYCNKLFSLLKRLGAILTK